MNRNTIPITDSKSPREAPLAVDVDVSAVASVDVAVFEDDPHSFAALPRASTRAAVNVRRLSDRR